MGRRARAMVLGAMALVGACGPPPSASDVDAFAPDAGITSDAARDRDAASSDANYPARDAYVSPTRTRHASLVAPSLLLEAATRRVLVVDPDADLLHVVTLDGHHEIVALPEGSEAGPAERVEQSLWVMLRGQHAVAHVDLVTLAVTTIDVCPAPRALDARTDTVAIACADGTVTLVDPATRSVSRRLKLATDDLGGVELTGDQLLVARTHTAEVLRVDPATGDILARWRPPSATMPDPLLPASAFPAPAATYEPRVALALHDGLLLYQSERATPIPGPPGSPPTTPRAGGYGAVSPMELPIPCAAVVHTHLVPVMSALFHAPTPPTLALANTRDFVIAPSEPGTGAAFLLTNDDHAGSMRWSLGPGGAPLFPACDDPGAVTQADGQVAGMAADGTLVAMVTRYPLQVGVRDREIGMFAITLDSHEPDDALGRTMFVRTSPTGVACVSCHPGGGDDGHVWTHAPGLPLHTLSLRVHLLSTAPFHWEGDLADMHALAGEVWVHRMGGAALTTSEESALDAYLDALEPEGRPELPADAVARGRALFESSEVGCVTCHDGPSFTNGDTVDVGTGAALQVPPLLGIAFRTPLMHHGCAATIEDRLTGPASCTGGDLHGHVSGLDAAAVADLAAYLRSL